MEIRTNNVPRFTVDAVELSESERADFGYLNWPAIEAGEDSATFIRYKGRVIDVAEIERAPQDALPGWQGYKPESFYSGLCFRFDDYESVIVGYYYN